jgi:hypothetical protein
MFNSTILDVAVGLIFTFLAVSLVASTATEALASGLKWRSATLLQGIKSLVNDQGFADVAKALYNHALVHPRGDGQANSERDLADAPAYVDPKHFADALIDVAGIASGTPAAIKTAVTTKIADPQLQQFLNGVIDRTGGSVEGIRGELASWFDGAMDRVSGAYKRKAQLTSFLIALAIAAALNVDSIHVGKALWQQPMLTKTLEAKAGDTPVQTLSSLDQLGLPTGWTEETREEFAGGTWPFVFRLVEMLLGWAITAFATLFGAPFWFDALQQIARLKGSGPSPAEKKANVGAAA